MKVLAFQAKDADSALARVHEELGPEAVVVSVRRLPPDGISRLWQRHGKLEVTACLPDKPDAERPATKGDNGTAGRRFPRHNHEETASGNPSTGRWRTVQWLESKGLLPTFVEQLEKKVYLLHGELPLATPEKEWAAVTDLVVCHWRQAPKIVTGTGRPARLHRPARLGQNHRAL